MRSLGESTYFLKAAYEPLKEIIGDKDYDFGKDPINGYIIHTDRIEGELLENVNDFLNNGFGRNFRKTHYNHNMEISWREINKYAKCITKDDMLAVNTDFRNDVTSDGWWIYPTPKLKALGILKSNAIIHLAADIQGGSVYCAPIYDYFPNVKTVFVKTTNESINYMFNSAGQDNRATVEEMYVFAPNAKTAEGAIRGNVLATKMGGDFSSATNLSLFAYYNYKLRIFDAVFPCASNMNFAFSSSQLNKESAIRILNSIPAYTSGSHPIGIGIHVDHKTDDEVLAAIANAEAKGWTLTVQWNGAPTAQTTSTFGLRKPSIYAKLSEIERPDGSKEQILDWGHYVSNPEDYEEFSSLEEAYEHFGLPNDLEN